MHSLVNHPLIRWAVRHPLLTRIVINLFPCYFGTGGKVLYITKDFKHVKVKVPYKWRTINIVGTIFGGTIYGAVDPIYMIMLLKILGRDYIVWDKATEVQYIKPGRGHLYADFRLSDKEISSIRNLTRKKHSIDRNYQVKLVDKNGEVHALVKKTLYIRWKKKDKPAGKAIKR